MCYTFRMIEDKLMAIFAGLFLAIVFSWIPWIMYAIVASVFTILPAVAWMQVTFFTWVVLTISLWYM